MLIVFIVTETKTEHLGVSLIIEHLSVIVLGNESEDLIVLSTILEQLFVVISLHFKEILWKIREHHTSLGFFPLELGVFCATKAVKQFTSSAHLE